MRMNTTLNRALALMVALLLALSAVGALAAAIDDSGVAIDAKNFPDETFRTYVQKFDKNKDGQLDEEEIKKVTKIDVSDREGLSSLKGVEFFTALKSLFCYETEVTNLDVSKNTRLVKLDVGDGILKKLKLGKQANLKWLNICYSSLKTVDISGCPKLLNVVTQPYMVHEADEMIAWKGSNDSALFMGFDTTLMKGKQVLRRYGKPSSVKFTKSKVTWKKNKRYNLFKYVKLDPASAVYPIKFTSSDKTVGKVVDGFLKTTGKAGTITVTVKVDSKKMATMKVTTK